MIAEEVLRKKLEEILTSIKKEYINLENLLPKQKYPQLIIDKSLLWKDTNFIPGFVLSRKLDLTREVVRCVADKRFSSFTQYLAMARIAGTGLCGEFANCASFKLTEAKIPHEYCFVYDVNDTTKMHNFLLVNGNLTAEAIDFKNINKDLIAFDPLFDITCPASEYPKNEKLLNYYKAMKFGNNLAYKTARGVTPEFINEQAPELLKKTSKDVDVIVALVGDSIETYAEKIRTELTSPDFNEQKYEELDNKLCRKILEKITKLKPMVKSPIPLSEEIKNLAINKLLSLTNKAWKCSTKEVFWLRGSKDYIEKLFNYFKNNGITAEYKAVQVEEKDKHIPLEKRDHVIMLKDLDVNKLKTLTINFNYNNDAQPTAEFKK